MELDSVYTINASNAAPYTASLKEDENTGHAVFKAQGGVANRPGFGKVVLGKKGAVSTVFHGNGPAKQAAFPAIKSVIEQGVEIGSDPNHNGKGFDTITFAAPVDFFGTKAPLGVVVKVSINGRGNKSFYIHEICDAEGNYIEIADGVPTKKAISSTGLVDSSSTAGTADDGISPKTSIRDEAGKVNTKSKAVDTLANETLAAQPTENGIKYSGRGEAKTFRNGQNARGEFTADVLIDLADLDSEWWTGKYNRAILGMSKTNDTEFRQFYQEILKRTNDMESYGEEKRIVDDSFVVHDGKGKEYIYVVKLDGYLHGVVLEKIDKKKFEAAFLKQTKGGQNGKSAANIKGRIRTGRSGAGQNNSGSGRNRASNSNPGYGGVGSGSSQSYMAGIDEGKKPADQKVSTVTDTDGQYLHSDRDTESVSNRSLLANAFEGVVKDSEKQKLQEYKDMISFIEAEERKLRELRGRIKELSFAKGPRDTKAIKKLRLEANKTANRINIYDKQLLRLEAAKPLQDVLAREKERVRKREERKRNEALEAYREEAARNQRELTDRWKESRKKAIEGREKIAMRHKIQNVVKELNSLLLTNDKKRHVPDSLKKAVAEALDLVNMDTWEQRSELPSMPR